MKKYTELRQKYPQFIYEDFTASLDNKKKSIKVVYTFIQEGEEQIIFHPTLEFILIKDNTYNNLDNLKNLYQAFFNIGMIELISYWKACASPQIIIKAGHLNQDQIDFFTKIYFNGLGEYLFLNKIKTTPNELFTIKSDSEIKYKIGNFSFGNGNIIPIGGGKDSIVSLELLKENYDTNYALILNPRKASLKTAEIAGYSSQKANLITIKRILDKKLLELNSRGFLNGHTPFSALLAFITATASIIYETKYIALSNENSASEGNAFFNNVMVNHQYSKSYDAEKDLNSYIKKYFSAEIHYFSLLRPLYEIRIAELFAKHSKYFTEFRSCNKGSKEDIWCGVCPKCLFVYTILSPFLSQEILFQIFNKNLFEDINLLPILKQLLGIAENKPFECVGTYGEVQVSLALALEKFKKGNSKLPLLLEFFETHFKDLLPGLRKQAKDLLNHRNQENLIPEQYRNIIL